MPTSSGGGGASGGSGALTLLSTTTLAVDGTFDVAAISGSYNDLLLVLIARGAIVGFSDNVQLRFNGDSGATQYYNETVNAVSTTVSSNQSGAASSIRSLGGGVPGTSSPASSFGVWECVVYGYASTTWLKAVTYEAFIYADPGSGSQSKSFGGGEWLSTAAVNRVQIQGTSTANLVTGSQLRIYGRL